MAETIADGNLSNNFENFKNAKDDLVTEHLIEKHDDTKPTNKNGEQIFINNNENKEAENKSLDNNSVVSEDSEDETEINVIMDFDENALVNPTQTLPKQEEDNIKEKISKDTSLNSAENSVPIKKELLQANETNKAQQIFANNSNEQYNESYEHSSQLDVQNMAEGNRLYPAIYDYDIESITDKPQRNPGVDITDYFNYGFTEESQRAYCSRQVQMRLEQTLNPKRISVFDGTGAVEQNNLMLGNNNASGMYNSELSNIVSVPLKTETTHSFTSDNKMKVLNTALSMDSNNNNETKKSRESRSDRDKERLRDSYSRRKSTKTRSSSKKLSEKDGGDLEKRRRKETSEKHSSTSKSRRIKRERVETPSYAKDGREIKKEKEHSSSTQNNDSKAESSHDDMSKRQRSK